MPAYSPLHRLALVAAVLSLALACRAMAADAARPPNIVFILADDLGYGDLGCYGQKRILTPNLDRLAAEGMRFTQFYAGDTVCAPSRCCIMTGFHTGHATIRGNALVPLRPGDVTVAQLLKDGGYVTGLVGKWGLGEAGTTGVPNRKGFDYFYGYLNQVHAHNYYPDYLWKNQEKVTIEGNIVKDGVATKRAKMSPDLFTKEALAFVETQPRQAVLPLSGVHDAARQQRARGQGGQRHGSAGRRPVLGQAMAAGGEELRGDGDAARRRGGQADEALEGVSIWTRIRSSFSAATTDRTRRGDRIPQFFDSAGPLRGIKRDLTEGGIREPMIVRWPGKVKAGVVSDQVGAFWDFLPTAADLAGAKAPAGLDGVSLAPTLLGSGKQAQHEFLYWEFHERGFQQAVRMGDWKAIRLKVGGPLELYDLKTDIGETHDVASDHPDVVAKIEEYLKGARTESADFPIKPLKGKTDGK